MDIEMSFIHSFANILSQTLNANSCSHQDRPHFSEIFNFRFIRKKIRKNAVLTYPLNHMSDFDRLKNKKI